MSFVDHIVQSAPQGSNPYSFAAEYVATIVPPKPHWYFPCVIAVGVIAAINLVSTIISFIVMWRRSRAGGGAGLWFFKTQHGHSSGIPYIVPNALTMFLFWNLVFMLLMQPYIWLNYVAYRSPNLDILSRMYFWYGFVFIWDSVGMWTSAFGTLYATLLPKLYTVTPSTRSPLKNLLLHPLTLNILCFLPPVGLAITQIITSVYSSSAWSNIVHTQFKLVGDLETLGVQWSSGGDAGLEHPLHNEAIELGNLFLEQKEVSQTAFQRNAGTCAGWYLLCIVLFAPTAVWLLRVIRNAIKMRTRRTIPNPHPLGSTLTNSSLTCPVPTTPGLEAPKNDTIPPRSPNRMSFRSVMMKPSIIATGSTDTGAGNTQQDTSTKELRRAFYTVGLQSTVTLFCMTATAGSWLWVCVDAAEVVVTPTLHAVAILLNIWIFAIVGCLVNLFILIRSYRADDQGTQHSSGYVVPMSPMSPMRSRFASSAHGPMASEQKSISVHASTSTHTVIDSPAQRLVRPASKDDLRLTMPKDMDTRYGSAYSLSTIDFPDRGDEKQNVGDEGGLVEEKV